METCWVWEITALMWVSVVCDHPSTAVPGSLAVMWVIIVCDPSRAGIPGCNGCGEMLGQWRSYNGFLCCVLGFNCPTLT